MRVLVTGAQGFVGQHLVRHLRAAGHEPIALGRRPFAEGESQGVVADLTDRAATRAAVAEVGPDAVVHLAGVTYVPEVLAAQERSFEVNVLGTDHLFDALRLEAPKARVLHVSSCTVYGAPREEDLPLTESAPLLAMHPYGVQKIGSEVLARRYREAHGLDTVVLRPFNHIGPGQDQRISVIHFAHSIAVAEKAGQPAVLKVGNLEPRRDFLDVEDVCAAYLKVLEHPAPPRVLNVSRGVSTPIRTMLDGLLKLARVPVEVTTDPARLRPADVMDLSGDAQALRAATGWEPTVSLATSLEHIMAHQRSELAS